MSIAITPKSKGEIEMLSKNLSTLRNIFAMLALMVCLSGIAMAQSILSDDAYTSSAPRDVDTNFGTNPNLTVSPTTNVYLKFKLSPTLPAGIQGSDVAKATLKLYLGTVTTPGTIDVFQLPASWSEKTITANNAPPLADLITSGLSVDASKKGQFLVIDVTTAARQWLDTSTNYGIALVAGSGATVLFDSKENSQTSHEPELIVTLNKSAGIQGPAGPQGS